MNPARYDSQETSTFSPDDTRFDKRVAELMRQFPFYGEEKARARAELELRLVDEMASDEGLMFEDEGF